MRLDFFPQILLQLMHMDGQFHWRSFECSKEKKTARLQASQFKKDNDELFNFSKNGSPNPCLWVFYTLIELDFQVYNGLAMDYKTC